MSQPRPLMVRQTIGRVFAAMFSQPVAQRGVPGRLADRIEFVADILARDLSEDPRRGWRWKTRADLMPMTRRMSWTKWRYETGRLTEGEVEPC